MARRKRAPQRLHDKSEAELQVDEVRELFAAGKGHVAIAEFEPIVYQVVNNYIEITPFKAWEHVPSKKSDNSRDDSGDDDTEQDVSDDLDDPETATDAYLSGPTEAEAEAFSQELDREMDQIEAESEAKAKGVELPEPAEPAEEAESVDLVAVVTVGSRPGRSEYAQHLDQHGMVVLHDLLKDACQRQTRIRNLGGWIRNALRIQIPKFAASDRTVQFHADRWRRVETAKKMHAEGKSFEQIKAAIGIKKDATICEYLLEPDEIREHQLGSADLEHMPRRYQDYFTSLRECNRRMMGSCQGVIAASDGEQRRRTVEIYEELLVTIANQFDDDHRKVLEAFWDQAKSIDLGQLDYESVSQATKLSVEKIAECQANIESACYLLVLRRCKPPGAPQPGERNPLKDKLAERKRRRPTPETTPITDPAMAGA